MSHIGREAFVASLAGVRRGALDVKQLGAEGSNELRSAGIETEEPPQVAGPDGVIASNSELEQLFALVDSLDTDGSRRSLATTTSAAIGPGGSAQEELTTSGHVYQALLREAEDSRTAARLGSDAPGRTRPRKHECEKPAARADDPAWFQVALAEHGQRELDPSVNTRILEYFAATRGGQRYTDDTGKQNAWCAAFMTWSLEQAGLPSADTVRAREYERFGEASEPFRGAIAVLADRAGRRHVALIAGVDPRGNLVFLGGNQDHEVNARIYPDRHVVAIRKPAGFEVTDALRQLPTIEARRAVSTR